VRDAEMSHLASSGRVQALWRKVSFEHCLARKITTIGDSRSDNRCAPVDSITRSAEADLAQNVFPVLQLPSAL